MSPVDIRVGFPPGQKNPFAIGKVLVAKTRITPGLMAAVGQPGTVERTSPGRSPFAPSCAVQLLPLPNMRASADSELTFWTGQLDRKRQRQQCLQGTGASLALYMLLLGRALDLLQTWISRKDELGAISSCHTGPLWCLVWILCNTSQGIMLY